MFSNETPSRPDWRPGGFQSKPRMQESALVQKEIAIERKAFVITLRENPRGRFVRIIERNSNRGNIIIIPATGLKEFQEIFTAMAKADREIPAKH